MKEVILQNIKNEALLNKESGTYLFYGDKRVNLLSYAKQFCKYILVKKMDENDHTDSEKKILNQIEIECHVDVEIINRNSEGLKIDEVRKIILMSIEAPYNSEKKIFIINGVESIRKESSNALLKIIEEPPKNVYFILLSRSLNILPTIKSRSIKFNILPLTLEELEVSDEVYTFFDGNAEYINLWKKNKIDLSNKIKQINEALSYIKLYVKYFEIKQISIEMIKNSDKLKNIIKDFKSILKEMLSLLEQLNIDKNKDEIIQNLTEINELISKKKEYDEALIQTIFSKINNIEILIYVHYINALKLVIKKLYVTEIIEYYSFLNDLESIFKGKREKLIEFLSKILLLCSNKINGENLKTMISLKNSLRSNVNIKSVISIYFNYLK